MKTAIIKICPESKIETMNIETNGVSTLDILDHLEIAMKHFAQELVKEAQQQVGNDPEAQAKWIDLQRQKSDQN